MLPARRMDVGEATETVLREADRAGYGSIATGRNSFRFTHIRRRPLFTSSVETFDLSVIDRRGGVSVHLHGTIWIPLLEFLHRRLHHDGHRSNPTSLPADLRQTALPGPPNRPGGAMTSQPIAAAPSWTLPPTIETSPFADAEPTVLRPRADSPTVGDGVPVVHFSNGDTRSLADGELAIGRDPSVDPQRPSARVVRIDDLSLSRTHLLVGADSGTVWVIDRHSTNGTWIEAGGQTRQCAPGVCTPVPSGGTVLFGGQHFVVDVRR
ncbi:MAG: hypothetical protein RI958_2842 [Actinomycetota bacterium]